MSDEEEKSAYGTAYCLSKNFLIWYVYSNISKFAQKKARIVSISPGTHLTRYIREMSEEAAKCQMAMNPLNSWGNPVDMAAIVDFLCSSGAKYITGSDILVDGGQTNNREIQQI